MNLRNPLALALAGVLVAPAVLAQTCVPSIRPSAPDERYAVNFAKGTVLDQRTGLTWKRCVEGLSGADCLDGSTAYLSWGAALRRAAASEFAGYKDWRLPNKKELESLVEVACFPPTLNVTVFPQDPSTEVWTSSPMAGSGFLVWYVSFFRGSSYEGVNDHSKAVRLVRGGQ